MDELDLLNRMRADEPGPDAAVLAAVRGRLTVDDRPGLAGGQRWRRHALIGVAAAAALAAGTVAVIDSGSHPAPTRATGNRTVPSTAPGTRPAPARVRFVSAAQVLDSAAAYTRNAGLTTIGTGQYTYVRVHAFSTRQIIGERAVTVFSSSIEQDWLPPSPTGIAFERLDYNLAVRYPNPTDKAYLDHNAPGGAPEPELAWYVTKGSAEPVQVYPASPKPPTQICPRSGCTPLSAWDNPTPATLAALPRDPVALRAALYRYADSLLGDGTGGQPVTAHDLAFVGAANVLASPILPNDLRAALYQVTKTIPGIRLVNSLANYDGCGEWRSSAPTASARNRT